VLRLGIGAHRTGIGRIRNPDGSTVLIVQNENDKPTTFGVTEDGACFRYAIPGGALATFLWNGDAGQPTLRPLVARAHTVQCSTGRGPSA
jgi:hypothetical protein